MLKLNVFNQLKNSQLFIKRKKKVTSVNLKIFR